MIAREAESSFSLDGRSISTVRFLLVENIKFGKYADHILYESVADIQ